VPASAMGNTRPARGQRTIANRRPRLRGGAALDAGFDQQPGGQSFVLPHRSLRRETQDREADEQKERQGEAKNEHDALPRPAQNDFTPARLIARIGCRLFLAHHRILAQ